MNPRKLLLSCLLVLWSASPLFADTSSTRKSTQENSACEFLQKGAVGSGDHPVYEIKKDSKTIWSVETEGELSVSFSPSGRYLAVGNSELDQFKGKGLLIVDCQTGKVKRHVKVSCMSPDGPCRYPKIIPKRWNADEKSLVIETQRGTSKLSRSTLKLR